MGMMMVNGLKSRRSRQVCSAPADSDCFPRKQNIHRSSCSISRL